jgi:hypothetical protein
MKIENLEPIFISIFLFPIQLVTEVVGVALIFYIFTLFILFMPSFIKREMKNTTTQVKFL